MKIRALIAASLAAVSLTLCGATDQVYNTIKYSTGDVVPGEWNGNFPKALAYAKENNIPLVVFWGNKGCGHCDRSEKKIGSSETFATWQKERGYVFCFVVSKIGTFTGSSEAMKFAGPTGSFPFVRCYWLKEDGTEVSENHKSDITPDYIMSWADKLFAGYTSADKSAGAFEGGADEGNRLEVESTTAKLLINLTREAKYKDLATTATLVAKIDSKELASAAISWAAGEEKKTVELDISAKSGLEDEDVIDLQIVGSNGKTMVKTTATYVEKANSAANPKWIGEKFDFGEWTMDLDGAKALAGSADGDAYIVASVQGSLWCPDCANTDRNFLDLEDEAGNNKFQAWAKSKKVALVTIDIPNFTTNGMSKIVSPTILSRDAFSTRLARDSYTNENGVAVLPSKKVKAYPKETPELTGADPALTNLMVRSGLGYLTRKSVSNDEATEVLTRNHELVTTDISNGGFHAPVDTNQNRTGVPIFVILRKDGSVLGRITKFAAVSPFVADRENFDYYIDRFEELMANSGADAAEMLNDSTRTTTDKLAGVNGERIAVISHADAADAYAVTNAQNSLPTMVRVIAADDAELDHGKVVLDLYQSESEIVASAEGDLAEGVAIEYTFNDPAKQYFVQVSADSTDPAFAIANSETTVRKYRLTTETIYGKIGFATNELAVAKDDGRVEIAVERTGGAIGAESVSIELNLAESVVVDDYGNLRYEVDSYENPTFEWADGEKSSKTFGITLVNDKRLDNKGKFVFDIVAHTGVSTVTYGRFTLNVSAGADQAPEFISAENAEKAYNYVSFNKSYKVVGTTGGQVTLRKSSGSIPSGISISWDDTTSSVVMSGVPKVAGTYEFGLTVSELRASGTSTGGAASFAFTVVDPTVGSLSEPAINDSCSVARTFNTVALVDESEGRLAGTLALTIGKNTGKISAKYTSAAGTVSFNTAKNWSALDEKDGTLTATLVSKNLEYTLDVRAKADGQVEIELDDPEVDKPMTTTLTGVAWSAANPADDWAGYYTVALPVEKVVSESVEGFASKGTAFLTLKMDSASAKKSGKFAWTLTLPNGTTASGTSVLNTFADDADFKPEDKEHSYEYAYLPILKVTKSDVFSALVCIQKNASDEKVIEEWRAAVLASKAVKAAWTHIETKALTASYEVLLGVYGGIYDTTEDLGACCEEYYETVELGFGAYPEEISSSYYGEFSPIVPVGVQVGSDTMKVNADINPNAITLKLNRKTGIVTGTFKVVTANKGTIKMSYRGAVLTGWGEGCGCRTSVVPKNLPFVNGVFYFKDSVSGATVQRGGAVSVDGDGEVE